MSRGVLSTEAVRRLEKYGSRVQASSKFGFQQIKYPCGHVEEFPERMEGAAMIEYIGIQPETAQKLWRTYLGVVDAQRKQSNNNNNNKFTVYDHVKTYLNRKFEEINNNRQRKTEAWTKESLIAAIGFSSRLAQSLIYLVRYINNNQRFKLNKISSYDLRDWAIKKIKRRFYQIRNFDHQVLLPNSPHLDNHHHHHHHLPSLSNSSLGMFPLSLGKDVVPGQIVPGNKKPVPDGFYIEKNGQLIPGWKAASSKNTLGGKKVLWTVNNYHGDDHNNETKDNNNDKSNNNIIIMPGVVANFCFAQVLPAVAKKPGF